MGATMFQANQKVLGDPQDPRSVATWRAALNELLHNGLLENTGSGKMYRVTKRGYAVADELAGQDR